MKKYVPIIATAIIVGGIAFYGGTKFSGNANAQNFRNAQGQTGQNGQRFLRNGGTGTGRTAGNFVIGKILSKDDKSITVELQNGGSKIVFLSSATQIEKSVEGTATDLEIGKNVMISGSANSDGSVSAQMVQLRNLPQGTTPTVPTQ